jgi:hypothetical protein
MVEVNDGNSLTSRRALALIWLRWVESPAASFPGLAATVAYCKTPAAMYTHVHAPMAQNTNVRHARRRVQRMLGQRHANAKMAAAGPLTDRCRVK